MVSVCSRKLKISDNCSEIIKKEKANVFRDHSYNVTYSCFFGSFEPLNYPRKHILNIKSKGNLPFSESSPSLPIFTYVIYERFLIKLINFPDYSMLTGQFPTSHT